MKEELEKARNAPPNQESWEMPNQESWEMPNQESWEIMFGTKQFEKR
jgi:hypothetical protein